jgi:AraC-like DNA-binding protein
MHDFFAVSLNDGGRGTFDCRGEGHDAAPGTCNLIAPGELHTGRATAGEGWIYRNLHIELPLMARLLESIEWRGSVEGIRFRSSLVMDRVLATRLVRAFSGVSEQGALLENESLLLSVVARLVTDHLVPGYTLRRVGWEHAAVTRAKEWLQEHCEQNVAIGKLADLAGLSPYYLVRAFHKQVGVPPHRYQTIVRVNRARKLVAEGAALSDVAYLTGFCDQSHLNRRFKKMLGVTPGRYAASRAQASACTVTAFS